MTRFGARPTLLSGFALIVVGLSVFALAPVDATYLVHIFPAAALLGLGGGLCFPPLMGLAMTGVAPTDAGLASGLVNTTAQVGGAVGLAVLATAANGRSTSLRSSGYAAMRALTGGYHLAFWMCAGLMATSFLIALVVLRDPSVEADGAAAEAALEPAAG